MAKMANGRAGPEWVCNRKNNYFGRIWFYIKQQITKELSRNIV